jgi:hypothetical protein
MPSKQSADTYRNEQACEISRVPPVASNERMQQSGGGLQCRGANLRNRSPDCRGARPDLQLIRNSVRLTIIGNRMRVSALLLILLTLYPMSVSAQDLQSSYGRMVVGPGDKGHALLEALRFTSSLNADSVGIAACTVEKVIGAEEFSAVIQPALAQRLLEPRPTPERPLACAIWSFQEDEKTRLYVEDFVQVRRESTQVLPYPERLAFEVRIQVLRGRGYREWHQIAVRPSQFESSSDGTHTVQSWRVIRYEVTGWQWMHDHSSSSGPIRE